ncbi:MAG: VWA domain-containing protein, partial [Clostridia bacterium]|nr:VWA domain-containing protein [Clostridia bacterium]
IVITDGAETISSNNIIKVVGALSDRGILIDAVFVDDNISDDTPEIQIDAVDAISSTYLNKEEEARVLLRVNCGKAPDGNEIERVNAYVNLLSEGELISRKAVSLYNGLNTVSIPLSTEEAGVINYEVTVTPESEGTDSSPHNNAYTFTQRITDERKVLFIGGNPKDLTEGRAIYGLTDVTYISNPQSVPVGIEDMCGYDEIVLCNFDIRTVPACDMFISSLTSLVDDYGKTLTTYGNTFIQEDDPAKENTPLKKLEELLPVRIGNFDQDKRLIAIVLDVSISMGFTGRFAVAQKAAVELIKALNTTDTVMVVGFSGVVDEILPPTALTASKVIIERINESTVQNGTN